MTGLSYKPLVFETLFIKASRLYAFGAKQTSAREFYLLFVESTLPNKVLRFELLLPVVTKVIR